MQAGLRDDRPEQKNGVFLASLVVRVVCVTAELSLKRKVVRGTASVIGGHVVGQILRLGGNLVLTRLLAPEMYGVLALVYVVVIGVQMLSDTGIRGSIVYHERGEDPVFLNTAWTLQIIRGVILWLVIVAVAGPVSTFYGKPELRLLLPVMGLSAIIDGFASTSRFTLVRRLVPARQVGLQLGARLLSICVMIAWALVWPSVWALVAGGLVFALANTVGSFVLIPEYVNRLMFDRRAIKSLFHYGRWILLSTGLSFLLSQGDRVFLGKVLSSEELGIYAIAILFTEGLRQPIVALASSILQPLYARLAERGSDELRRKTFQARALILAATVPGAWIFAIFGQQIIQFLYDARYWDAGWMLRILSVGVIGSILGLTADRAIVAAGDSLSYLILQIFRTILLIIGMTAGVAANGLPGLLIGLSCARLLEYVPLAYFLRRHGVWLPQLDLTVLGVSAGVIASGAWFVGR